MILSLKLFIFAVLSVYIVACGIGGHWMTGDPSVGVNVKPYGAHWIKEGVTKESRREDIAACGAKGNESVNFLPHEIQAAKQPDDPNDIKAMGRLTKEWAECMRGKGYIYLEYCDERCQYP